MIKNAKDIRASANIVQIISESVTLQRRGAVHVGLCPFHEEKSPSFTVYPTTNTFKCFGCNEGGDAVHFLIEHKGMTYPEALEHIAKAEKTEIEYENNEKRQEILDAAKQEAERRKALQECLHTVHAYYAKQYPLNLVEEKADADGRLLSQETVATFGICYTPDENAVVKAGFWDDRSLLEIGLAGAGQNGYGNYDFFRNRLLFRITDNKGGIAGLAGRRLRKDDTLVGEDGKPKRAKYINSKESVLYKKSNLLFGLHENRKGIRDAGYAILVEGYFDVITPHDYGVQNCVAPCGTALTDQQADLLKRYTDEVVVLRDGDEAGLEAAKRDIETLTRAGLKVRVVLMIPPTELIEKIEKQKVFITEQELKVGERRQSNLDKKIATRQRLNKKHDAGLEPSENEAQEVEDTDPILKREARLLEAAKTLLVQMEADLSKFNTSKDPDDFVRQHGKEAFLSFIEDNSRDGIVWRVMSEITDKDNIYQRDTAIVVAASLLNLIESESLRESYIRDFCKASNLGSVKKILSDAIDTQRKFKGRKSDLTAKQKDDIVNYGFYERENRYYICSDISGLGWPVSNFVIKPIIFIEGQKESIRLVEITNDKNIARILDINSRNFVDLGPFRQTVEARGNYRFEGKPEYFGKIKAKVYDQMRTAFPIYTLGQHREGFFTFANGLIIEGKFMPVDEFGLVSFGETRYYLPAFSKIRDHIKSDDVDNDYQDEQYYVYNAEGAPEVTFQQWTKLMREVHGDNAIPGILYACACIIREKVFERLDQMFPHLNFFGQPGSGKNQLAASLIALFGKYRQPVHIVNATDAAFFRRAAQGRNMLAWYDEYSNNVEHKRIEALKQFADGTGRSRASVDNPNRTISTPVNSGIIMSGQQQPTQDVALFTRCISLSFATTEFTPAQKEKHARLKKIEQTGRLTQFVADLHRIRPALLDQFALQFEEAYTRFQGLVAGQGIMDRIVRSYVALLTTYDLLQDKVAFGFTKEDVEKVLMASIITQKEAVFQENEVSIFWRIIEFFIANGEIEHGADLLVEETSTEVFDLDWSGKNKESKDFKPSKRLLYLSFTRTHPLYLERHQRQRNVKGLDLEALKHYLKASGAYEGFKRAKKFNGASKACFIFDVEKLPFEFEDSIAVLAKRRQREEKDPAGEPGTSEKTAIIPSKPVVTESPVDETTPF